MATEKIAVIGSNSFSGAHFVAHCLRAGMEVIGISRSAEPASVFLPYQWIPHDRFRFFELDLNRHLSKIVQVLWEFRPEYIVNFAAQGMVAQSWNSPEDWLMTNTVSMVRLHEELRKSDSLRKFVHASTPEVYGNTPGLVREDTPYNPSTPYAVSKAACDMSLLAFRNAYNFPVALTRAANVCGPGQQLYRIIPKTIFCILNGQRLKLEGGGASVRSFIHVRDVCDGTLQVVRQAPPGEIFHLATDRQTSIRELVETICRKMNVPFERCMEVVERRLGQDTAYRLDCTKARTVLGWVPRISLDQTIDETIDWVRTHIDALRAQPATYVHKK